MKNEATKAIEQDFPDWMAWISERGEYWGAVRRSPAQGVDPTVIADSEDELRAELIAQALPGNPSK